MKKLLIVFTVLLIAGCSAKTNSDVQMAAGDMHLASSQPLEGKTIIIDPGHGGDDPGAIGEDVFEKDLNLRISKSTKQFLEEQGADVYLTRNSDINMSFEERTKKSEEYDADIFVSIHNNTNELSDINGTEVYYNNHVYEGEMNPFPEESYRLAHLIHESLSKGADLNPMGVKESAFNVLRTNSVPSVIVEVGFLTNPEEALRLQDKDEQKIFGQFIAEGISDYFLGIGVDQYVLD